MNESDAVSSTLLLDDGDKMTAARRRFRQEEAELRTQTSAAVATELARSDGLYNATREQGGVVGSLLLASMGDAHSRFRSASMQSKRTVVETVTQRWEGVVLKTFEPDFFEVELSPVGEGPAVVADISYDAVQDDDRALIDAGTAINVYSGRTTLAPGRSQAFCAVHVRRLGRWRGEDLDFLREKARKNLDRFDFV